MITREEAFKQTREAEVMAIDDLIAEAVANKEYFITVDNLTEAQTEALKEAGFDVKVTELMGGAKTTISWK